jgi:hypothetical protein
LILAHLGAGVGERREPSVEIDSGLDVERRPVTGVRAVVGSRGSRSSVERKCGVATGIEGRIVELEPTGLLGRHDAFRLQVRLLRDRHGRGGSRHRKDAAGQQRSCPNGNEGLRGQGAVQPLLSADRTARVKPKATVIASLEKMRGQRSHPSLPRRR